MSMGRALKAALADFYRQSWRLVLLNSAFSIAALGRRRWPRSTARSRSC